MPRLFRVKARPEHRQHFTDFQMIKKFRLFLKKMWKKRALVIHIMEDLIPGSGLDVIHLGYTYNDYVRDLSPTQLFEIFKEMQTWEGYDISTMRNILSLEDEEGQTAAEDTEDVARSDDVGDDLVDDIDDEDDNVYDDFDSDDEGWELDDDHEIDDDDDDYKDDDDEDDYDDDDKKM